MNPLPPLPEGFEPVSPDDLAKNQAFVLMMHAFARDRAGAAAGVWSDEQRIAATEAAIGRVLDLCARNLIRYGRHSTTDEIALFLAERAYFEEQQDWDDADMLLGHFRVTGDYDHRTGELIPVMAPPPGYYEGKPIGTVGSGNQFVKPGDPVYKLEERTFDQWLAMYPLATHTLAEECRVRKSLVEEILRRWSDAKTLRWIYLPEHQTKDVGPHGGIYGLFPGKPPETPSGAEKAVLKQFQQTWDVSHPRVLPEFGGRIAMSDTGESAGALYVPDDINVAPKDHMVINVETWANDSQIDCAKIAASVRMSKRVMLERMQRLQEGGHFRVYRKIDRQPGEPDMIRFKAKNIETLDSMDRQLIEALSTTYQTDQRGRVKFGEHASALNHMRAIDAQYGALVELQRSSALARAKGVKMFGDMTAAELWQFDIDILKRADTYCWFPDQTTAVEAASVSLPTSVRLTRDLVDGYSGWWYFVRPLDITTTDDHHEVWAILWSWSSSDEPSPFKRKQSGIVFSAYIVGEKELWPSTKFFWPEGTSLDQMLTVMAGSYDERYHTGALPHPELFTEKTAAIGKERTLEAVERMARFFASGALWIQQRILVMQPAPVGRQNRKRMENDGLIRPLNDVQVIQLRRKQSVRTEPAGEAKAVNWKCRWVVNGFWRNQFYPKKGRHEPKWIHAFIKGPEGLPLKVPQHRIYTVNR